LQRNGLKPDSYELVAAGPPPERCEKLKQGLITATMVTQPFDFLLEEAGFGVIASSLDAVPTYPFTVCVVRKTPDIDEKFVAFLKVLKRAWEWLADPANRARAVEILSRATETAPAQAERTYDLYLELPSPPSLEPTHEGVATMLDLLAESGRLPRPLPTARRYVDERYFERL
jgi:ABC-type nitrate/sulfonate/bicarbonate transport system substrate-binding protein